MLGPNVKLADLNHDRKPDLVRVQSGMVSVLPNISDEGAFAFGTPQWTWLSPWFEPLATWVHDFNGDGIPDLISKYSEGLAVWFGKGNYEFVPDAQLFSLYNAFGPLSALENWGFTFVDANKDGLSDIVLTHLTENTTVLFMNRGLFLEETAVVGLQAVDAWFSRPVMADFRGTGNTEIAYTRAGVGYAVPLDGPETGLMRTADDGRGTVLTFGYRRSKPAPGQRQRQRQSVMDTLTVESSGHDPVTYSYDYGIPKLHTVGRFLLGYDQVTRTDPLLNHSLEYLNEDRYSGVPLSSSKHDKKAPAADAFESRTYDEADFQGIPWKRLKQEISGFRDATGATVSERTEYLSYVNDFCPQVVEKTTATGVLSITKGYFQPSAFGNALPCLWTSAIESGTHADKALDFRHETALARNAVGLVERVESVNGAERWVLQSATYRPTDWLVETISSPGKGTTTLSYLPATRLLSSVTTPDGVVVAAASRDPLHDGILTLETTRNVESYRQFFRFDGQERLRSQWDDLGGSTELNPVARYAYQWATQTKPAAVYSTQLVDLYGASARESVDLLTASGEPVVTASRIPEGWSFGSLLTRTPAIGQAKRHLRPSVAPTIDPMALDYTALLAEASPIGSDESSPMHGEVVDARTTFHAGVEQHVVKEFAVSGGLLQLTTTENGANPTRAWLDAGKRVLTYDDEAGVRYTYTRDAMGRVRALALPDGKRHRALYDAHGRVWRIERDGVANIEYAFDAVTGLPTTKKYFTHAQHEPANALVRSTSFAYDAIGRVQTETHTLADGGSSKVFTFYYDGATPSDLTARTTVGLLTAVAGDGFTRVLEYRPDAKVKRKLLTLGDWRKVETTYSYLESGILGGRTVRLYDGIGGPLSTSTQSYFHDAHGRLGTVKLNGALLATFDYDPNGQISGATFANGNRLELTYDPLTRRHTGASLATADYSSSTSLRLNARGLLDGEMLTVGAVNLSRAYGYSAQRFLTSAADARNNYAYDFDGFGLPKSVTTNGATRSIVESPNSLVAGTVTYTFDGLHRTVSRSDSAAPAQNLALAYGPDGHLASAVRDGVTYTFLYDEAGQRLMKLSGAAPVAAYLDEGYLDGTGLTERFAVAGRTVGTIRNGVFTALATDLRGSVMAETTGTPRIGSPFGQRDIHPAQAAAIDYVEKGYDADLGWVRMGVRDYDPEINRFTTADPLYLEHPEKGLESPVECNLFAYARNAPSLFVDPSGEKAMPGVGPLQPLRWMDLARDLAQQLADTFNHGLDKLQATLDVAGLVPVVGTPADVANSAISAGRGDWKSAAINLAGVVGADLIKVAKLGKAIDAATGLERNAAKKGAGAVDDVFHVTPDGVVLPKGPKHKIPEGYVENPHRSGSYGEIVNEKFKERLRIDPPTPPGQKGPNVSHYHLDGKGKHFSPAPGDKDPGFQP